MMTKDVSNEIANALELLQSCIKPSIHSDIPPKIFHVFIHENTLEMFSAT